MTRFELNILGCGSATSTLKHLPSCQVLNVRDNLMMIDCGEGAQLEMRRQRLKFSRLSHIFLSHLHGDHCFGLPGLLSTLALLGKSGTLTIHTFADGKEQFGRMLDYFCREMPYTVEWDIIGTRTAIIHEDNAITVTAFPLRHRVPAVGFRFDEKPKLRHIIPEAVQRWQVPHHAMNSLRQGSDYITPDGHTVPNAELTLPPEASRSFAYASDTMPSRRVVRAVEGVDWLYHEATYAQDCVRQAHSRYHSTARDAATVARDADVGQLIIGHFSNRYDDATPLLREAQEVFPHTRLAAEGMVVDLNGD
ncbi:MAG: ribonuclease Z [Muribaculaceae bacterium]|nr:ribonuclease Z [Muribaculaceae bacterium]